MLLSINYTHAEPCFRDTLPAVCRRKPNFIGPWMLRATPNDDIPGEHFEYWQRDTTDGLSYIVDP